MTELRIDIDLSEQRLRLLDSQGEIKQYAVSTAADGAGERMSSNRTPRGRHVVRALIGRGAPVGTVFVARRPTGEIYTPELGVRYPGRDWILSRIIWLSGLEPGRNRFGDVDTMRRYIYIHGAFDEAPMGRVGSHGCVRMSNSDVVDLFDRVRPGVRVYLHE